MNKLGTFFELTKSGFMESKLPDSIFSKIKEHTANDIKNNFKGRIPYNNYLAGQIKHEYFYEEGVDLLLPFVNDLGKEFVSWWDMKLDDREFTFHHPVGRQPSCWINYQQKHEYNPPHNHDGLLSFVIWVNIPYEREKEDGYNNSNVKGSISPPDFHMFFPDWVVGIQNHNLQIDKSYEGKIAIFQSHMWHFVGPFTTTDDYRISISGNLIVE